jgi:hypothetical protein
LSIINHGQITKTFGADRNQITAVRTRIEIQTNAGNRIVEYEDCSFVNSKK